jgi:hypothetical protein
VDFPVCLADDRSCCFDFCIGEGIEWVRRRSIASDMLSNRLESVQSHIVLFEVEAKFWLRRIPIFTALVYQQACNMAVKGIKGKRQ